MRAIRIVAAAALLVFCLASCAKKQSKTEAGDLSVALLINGNLGDKSFHDSANNGIALVKEQLGCKTRVVEVGYDDSKWEPALRDLCDEKYTIIVCGTWQMQDVVTKVAKDYPEQKMIIYDTSVDYSGGANKNIYSMEYKQNEGSYLAGALAANMSKSGIIGFVGGIDTAVINDFLVGYIQGAKAVNPGIKVVPSYIGNFSDTAKAKELTFAQYAIGADIVFSVAANAGDGALQASKERGRYAIGVDSDQAMLYSDSDPEMAKLIISSVLKKVDQSILIAVRAAAEGNLAWGTRAVLGIEEDCVGLANNAIYQSEVPGTVKDRLSELNDQIKAGGIRVDSAFGMEQAAFNDYVNAVRP